MARFISASSAAVRSAIASAESTRRTPPRYEFYVTDVPLRFQTIGERFLGRTLSNVHVVKW